MNFSEFEAKFIWENRILKFVLIGSLALLSFLVFMVYSSKSYFLVQGGEIFKEDLLLSEICKRSFQSLTSGEHHPYLLSEGIISIVEKEPFNLDDYSILKLNEITQNTCKVIIKEGEKIRAFKIEFDLHDENPFFYKLLNLEEFEFNS